jgi:hypothetical protein
MKKSFNGLGVTLAGSSLFIALLSLGLTYLPPNKIQIDEWTLFPALMMDIFGTIVACLVYTVMPSQVLFLSLVLLIGIFQWYWIGVVISKVFKYIKGKKRG